MEGAILKLAEGIMSFPENTFKNSAFFFPKLLEKVRQTHLSEMAKVSPDTSSALTHDLTAYLAFPFPLHEYSEPIHHERANRTYSLRNSSLDSLSMV